MEPAGNVGHAGDPNDNPAVNERSERLAELERGFGRVDVPGLGGEMLDRLRQDARAGRQDQGRALASSGCSKIERMALATMP